MLRLFVLYLFLLLLASVFFPNQDWLADYMTGTFYPAVSVFVCECVCVCVLYVQERERDAVLHLDYRDALYCQTQLDCDLIQLAFKNFPVSR